MFGGLSAKERMAQLQAKSAKDNPPPAKPPGPAGLKKVGKPNGASPAAAVDPSKAKSPEKDKPEIKDAGKGNGKPKEPEKKEDAKPAEKPAETKAAGADKKTTEVSKKEEAKPKEPEKPKEESKKPEEKKDKAAAAKPKEEPKPKENEKPKEEAKKAEDKKEEAKPKEEKPKDEPKPAEKPKDAPKPEVKEPSKPAEAKKDDSKPAEKQAPNKDDDKKKEEPSKTAPTAEKPKEETKPSATEKPKEEPKAAEKPKEEPKVSKPQEPSKPKEETPKAKEGPKPEAAPTAAPSSKDAAKPKEDQPAKPAQTTAAATQDKPAEATKKESTTADKKPAEEAKKDAKPKEEAKPAAAAAPAAAPKETPKAKEEPAKPAQESKAPAAEPKKPEVAKPAEPVKAKSVDDLYTAIFYFSGMGNLLGSALAEGVFVPERSRSAALDNDEVEKKLKGAPGSHRNGETVVATARAQAHVLSNDFRQLQALLETMPKFGDTPLDGSLLPSSADTAATKPVDRRAVDQPIHGHVYFQQPDRPAHQQPHHHQQQQQQHTGPPFQMTPTAVAVRAADEHNTVVHLASLSGAGEGKGRPPAAGAVQVLPTASPAPQANYTSTVYRPPQQSKTPTFADAIDNFEATQHHLQPSQHGRSATGRISPYGGANDYDLDGARKSGGGNVDASGVKSWQLSHLRTLEAKGYRVLEEPPAPAPPPPPADVTDHEIFSYSPYLVSGRTLNADRRQTFQKVSGPGGSRPGVDGYGPSPTVGMMRPGPSPRPASFRPASVGSGTYPFSPVSENSLPYCDL